MSEYPSDWSVANLGEIASIKASNVDKKSKDGQRDILLCNYMDIFKNPAISNSLAFMRSTASDKEISEFSLCKGDVLLTKDSEVPEEIGIPSIVAEGIPDLVCGYHLYMLRPNSNRIDPGYLCWALRSNESRQYFYQMANGSTRFGLNLMHVEECSVPIPPLPEQKKIAEILSTIDLAIETKIVEQEKKRKATDLLLGNLLNKNEAQEVPLSEFATLERGRFSHRPRNDPAYYGGQIPFIQTGDIPKSGISITEHKQTLNENGLRVSRMFKKGTIVITIAATIGEVGILQYPACFPDSLVGITPYEDRCNPVYLLFALRNLKDRLLQMAPRSAQSNLNLEILGKLMIPLPPLSDQDLLARIFSCETKRNHAETISVSKLQYLRAAISSDLLSGRKRVSV